jgi:phosphoglycolate phosphatase
VGNLHRRLIAFDLDGTLVDSRQDLADSANALLVELGGRPLSTEAITAMVGEGAAVLVQRALVAARLSDPGSALTRFLSIYDERLLEHTRLYPGIADLLTAARRSATVAVLTNKPLRASERILSGLGIRDLVDHVVGGDGPYPRKPDPAGLLALMAETGAGADSTLLIGDSPVDRETARRAGAFCCLVTYGFGRANEAVSNREWLAEHAAAVGDVVTGFVERSTSQVDG